ncbi:MAG: hypothetical protein AYK22_05050 [Thermoplasmatales archaeon SG8-52-3]|nr:MAG: hypothetical protein AYK22_05050 [Thermoplasmatales archaeon SG8-52-3]
MSIFDMINKVNINGEVEKLKDPNKITKKLQKLVESRKTSIVVSKQDAYKQYSRPTRKSTSMSDYIYSSIDDT